MARSTCDGRGTTRFDRSGRRQRRILACVTGAIVPALLGSSLVASEVRGTEKAGRNTSPTRDTRADIPRRESKYEPQVIIVPQPPALLATVDATSGADGGGIAGTCSPILSQWTNSDFGPGEYIAQGGFAENEIAAVSFTLSPDVFPIKLDLTEMIFATSAATVETTTHWSILIGQGTPATGQVIESYSSETGDLPPIVLPPGTNGVNVQFMVDPGDPDQIFIEDDGSHSFWVGYRIDEHNNQTQNPCLVSPPANSNAFPTTDTSGVASLTGNWIFAVNCGQFGCPAGWSTFAQLPIFCRPSGDWVIRVTWTPFECAQSGACCLPNGGCAIMTEGECAAQGGNYLGDGAFCGIGACDPPDVACCFESGGCLNLPADICALAGGFPGPAGSVCGTYECFPEGACCLPTGDCIGPVSPEECAAQGGAFQGNNTSCATTNCPEPLGACCFSNGFCLQLTQGDCESVGATWTFGASCADTNGNGSPDACENAPKPGDINGDGSVDAADLAALLGAWGQGGGAADVNGDGIVDAGDLAALLGGWG